MKYDYIIGIDPGTNTGFSTYSTAEDRIVCCETIMIHTALQRIILIVPIFKIFVRVEDARQRKWFGKNAKGKEQGAGSIKRDCSIWEDFLVNSKIPFEMTSPGKVKTKVTAEYFKKLTGYEGKTSEHSRDAGLLCYRYKPKDIL
jgi:hypothetical protein